MGDVNRVSNCWFITCWFDDVPVEALVDTGAEASVISSRMLRQLGTKAHSSMLPSMTQFRGIGGDQRSLGTADFYYTIGTKADVHLNAYRGSSTHRYDIGDGRLLGSCSDLPYVRGHSAVSG